MPRVSAPITVDGDLSDPAWKDALVIDTFYEIAFGDNRKPNVRTVARLLYDDRHLYLAVECDDPDPGRSAPPTSTATTSSATRTTSRSSSTPTTTGARPRSSG